MKEIQTKIETLQNMLTDIATGGSGIDDEFKKLRSDLLSIDEINDLIPDFVKTN